MHQPPNEGIRGSALLTFLIAAFDEQNGMGKRSGTILLGIQNDPLQFLMQRTKNLHGSGALMNYQADR